MTVNKSGIDSPLQTFHYKFHGVLSRIIYMTRFSFCSNFFIDLRIKIFFSAERTAYLNIKHDNQLFLYF